MKKLFITIGLAALVSSSQAQGTLNFLNAAATVINLSSNSVALGNTPATVGGFRYELFFAPAGTLNPALFVGSGVIATNTTAGRFTIGTGSIIPGAAAGGTSAIMIRGWSASLGADWATAILQQGIIGGFFGQSAIAPNFLMGGGPLNVPTSPVFGGANGILPLVVAASPNGVGFTLTYVPVVPEPTSMALAGIGAAAMVIFRRRK